MSINEMERTARELKELKIMADELAVEITALEDAIKAAMGDSELMVAGAYKITWKPVTASRVDTSALKAALPDVAARYMKTTTSRRFTVN